MVNRTRRGLRSSSTRQMAKVGSCAGFSDAASRGLSCARCLPASEKRQGTKSRGRCAEGSGSPMGNRRRRDGRLGVQSGGDRRRRCCRAPVLIAHPGVARVGFVVAASGWRCGPDARAQLIRAAAASRIDHGVQEALWRGHELSMASGTGRCCGGPRRWLSSADRRAPACFDRQCRQSVPAR